MNGQYAQGFAGVSPRPPEPAHAEHDSGDEGREKSDHDARNEVDEPRQPPLSPVPSSERTRTTTNRPQTDRNVLHDRTFALAEAEPGPARAGSGVALNPDRIWQTRERRSSGGSVGSKSGLPPMPVRSRMQATAAAGSRVSPRSSRSRARAPSSSAFSVTCALLTSSGCGSWLRISAANVWRRSISASRDAYARTSGITYASRSPDSRSMRSQWRKRARRPSAPDGETAYEEW